MLGTVSVGRKLVTTDGSYAASRLECVIKTLWYAMHVTPYSFDIYNDSPTSLRMSSHEAMYRISLEFPNFITSQIQ